MEKNGEKITKKTFRKIKEVSNFYKLVHKYKLQKEAYKQALLTYIKFRKDVEK